LSEKARFIKLVLKGDIKVKRIKIFDLIGNLKKHSFKALREIKGPTDGDEAAPDADEEEKSASESEDESEGDEGNEAAKRKKVAKQGVKDYEYLVGMPIITLTMEKVQELTNQKEVKVGERDALKKKAPKQLWLDDLDVLDEALNDRLRLRMKEERDERSKIETARAKAGYKDARRTANEAKEKQKEVKRAASAPALGRLKKQKTAA